VVVSEPKELLDVAKILSLLVPPAGRRVAVMSFQAGPGILLTDEVARSGLSMATFSSLTQDRLNQILPPLTIRTNPVDLAFARDERAFAETVGLILKDANVDTLVVFLLHHPFMTPRRIKGALLRQRENSGKPILLCANSPRGLIEEEIAELEAGGIPVYSLPDRTIRALRGLVEYGEIRGKGGKGEEAKREGNKGIFSRPLR
jgi:acyl-CoA synthetase (NDP forming)